MKRALVVGINCYLKLGRLHTPANDANAVAQRLHDIGFEDIKGLPATEEAGLWVSSDPDKQVSKDELEKAIEWLFAINEKSHIPETALFYFAGHGLRSVKVHRSKGFLATSKANPEKPSSDKSGVSLVDVRQILEHSPIKKQIVILDCCHGGEVFNYKEVDPGNSDIVTRCLMSACGENQAAFEPEQGQGNHSYFTSTLLDGLQQSGRVTTETLWVYVQEKFKYKLQQVRRNNLNDSGSYQEPKCDNRDGAIVLIEPEIDPESESTISNPNFNPYKGLEAFQEADAPYFFGRRKLTRTFVNKIYDQPFLAVAGSSGSGKSSLVRAGLIPELKQGTTLSETADWQIHDPFKPGDDPLASLAQVFVDENNEHLSLEKVNAALAQGATGLKRLMTHIKSPTVLLVVDQFEQLFTQRPSEEKRRQFLDCLCGAIDSDSPRNQGDGRDSSLRVVITIRDDFLGKCAEYPQLLKMINQNKQIVGPMNEGELRNAISQPVKKLAWKIPRDLETEMVKDVQNSPGSLPLLQYVLQQMVERRHNHGQKLTVETYQEIGGVQQALERRADKVYKFLSIAQQAIARSIFLKLTQLLENSKPIARQVRKSELTDLPYPPEEVETVLENLEAERLIVTSELAARGNPEEKITVVDVAHESLISNWKQLERWVKENFDVKRQEEDIQKKARDWADKGKRREGLLRGLDLAEVELFEREHSQTFPLSPLAREFVRKSIRQRRNSRLLGIGAVVTVFSVVTGLWLNAQRQATIANLGEKAARATNLLTSADPVDGLVLAIQATGESQDKLGQVLTPIQSSLLDSLQTAREQNRLRDHQGWVRSVAISPDGQTVVSGSDDNTLRLWNRQGELIGILRGHQGRVDAVAISPDGQTIVSGSWDNTLRLWNRQGEPIGILRGHQNYVSAITISPDGQTIVSGSWDNTVRLWNRQGESIGILRGHQDSVYAVAISADGQTIVSGSSDNTVRLWNRQGEQIGVLRGHQGRVDAVAISADGQTIVSGSSDSSLRLWNRRGEQIGVLRGHQSSVNAVVISADGQTIISGGMDNTVRLWNRQWAMAIVSASDDNTMNLGHNPWVQIRELRGHHNPVSALAISADGETIVSGSGDNTVRLWDRQGEIIRELRHQGWINAVAISPDGQTIVSGSLNLSRRFGSSRNTLRLWNRQGELIGVRDYYQSSVLAFAISPDGQTIVSGGNDNTLRLWNLQGEQIRELRGHQDSVQAVAISADGQTIVSGSDDNTLRLWNRQGEQIRELRGHQSLVNAVAISADGETIVSGSGDNTLRLWNRQGEPIRELRGHQNWVNAVAISADGETIVSGSGDNTLRLWNRQGQQIGVLRGHQSWVNAVAISADGETIVSGSWDSTVRLWPMGWNNWLQLACNQLQYHPVLIAPETDVARDAGETCQNHAWTPSESAQFLVNQGKSLARAEDIEGAVAKFNQANRLDATLDLDPEAEAKRVAVQALVEAGNELAYQGDYHEAVTKFQQALTLDPTLDLDPETEAKQIAVPVLLARGEQQVEDQDYQAAVEAYTAAQTIDATLDISADTWDEICWFGSLRGEPEAVMPACEQAVTLEPEKAEHRGSLGLAKGLTGDTEGAIQEFQAFIELSNNAGENRVVQGYINTLRAGDNPFTEAEIQRLLGEESNPIPRSRY